MPSLRILILALQLINVVSGEPIVSFPLNSQLPPVARIDEPFSYAFSPYTFKSDANITYSLGDAPKWISISSNDRRLYGTPTNKDVPAGDVVGQSVEIIADDGSGQASLNATLVITRTKAPSVKIPISEQIEHFGDYSAPSSLLSYPSTDFSYTFDSNTFDHQPNMVNYYATSSDSSPLPAWMKFDAHSMTFRGRTPPFESLIQPPQTFGFRLVASDIVGFSAAGVSFNIVVGSHKLTTDNPVITLNATRGKELSYKGLAAGIKLDNKAANPGDVEVSTDRMPKWLSLDEKTWEIKGKPAKGDASTNFTINFRDKYSDTLTVEANVNVATGLFRSVPKDVNITAGRDFGINLEQYFWDPNDIKLALTVDPDEDWLDLDGFNITGKVPSSASGRLKVTINASSKSSELAESETLNLQLLATTPSPTTTISPTSTSTSATSTETGDGTAETTPAPKKDSPDGKGLSTSEILLATLLPILFIALLTMLLVWCCLRRRKGKETYLHSTFRSKISEPVLESLRVNGGEPTGQEANKAYDIGRTGQPSEGQGYSDFTSQPSGSSNLPTPELPSGFMLEDSGGELDRSVSALETDESRHSWVTVEGTVAATARQSMVSLRSAASDTTFPESTHQLLPPPSFLSESGGNSFRSGLDLVIPSLEDLPSLRQQDTLPHSQTGTGLFSTLNESSLGFSASHTSSPRLMTGLFGRRTVVTTTQSRPASRGKAPLLPEEDETETVPELRRPDPARLSSQQWFGQRDSRAWYDTDSSNGSRGFRVDPSFGSSENWRVISGSRHDALSMSYRELVDEAPFHPNRLSTAMSVGREGARPGERTSSELMSPSQWGDARTSVRGSVASMREVIVRSVSRYSQIGEEVLSRAGSRVSTLGASTLGLSTQGVSTLRGSTSGAWRREDSGKKSEGGGGGGSFKAFL